MTATDEPDAAGAGESGPGQPEPGETAAGQSGPRETGPGKRAPEDRTQPEGGARHGLQELIAERRARAQRLRETAAAEDFPYSYPGVEPIESVRRAYERLAVGEETEEVHRVAGRIAARRGQGRAAFLDLVDRSGKVQLHARLDVLGEEPFQRLRALDLGDVIGVDGAVLRSRHGELTLRVDRFAVLAKALRPPPDKHHGLTDVETRHRRRELDLISSVEVRARFRDRARIVAAVRAYLDGADFVEVETPVLQPVYGGALARPFTTHHNALDRTLYLRIATELYLKRCIVGGLERVYELGKDFRNEGVSTRHNPEFTVVEWYEAYADYEDAAARLEALVRAAAQAVARRADAQRAGAGTGAGPGGGDRSGAVEGVGAGAGPGAGEGDRSGAVEGVGAGAGPSARETPDAGESPAIDLSAPWRRVSFVEAIHEATGIDVMAHPDARGLAGAIAAAGLPAPADSTPTPPSWPQLADELLSSYVEPSLREPTFVFDYPIALSPFAREHRSRPGLAERWEAFLGGMEIANAFSELVDPDVQRERFAAQQRLALAGDEETQPHDEIFLQALEQGMPPTAGVGLGIDRLVMALTGQSSIREVILFPAMR